MLLNSLFECHAIMYLNEICISFGYHFKFKLYNLYAGSKKKWTRLHAFDKGVKSTIVYHSQDRK